MVLFSAWGKRWRKASDAGLADAKGFWTDDGVRPICTRGRGWRGW